MPSRRAALLALATIAAGGVPPLAAAQDDDAGEHAPLPAGRRVTIPVREPSGDELPMATQVFLPSGEGPFPVVVFSHGRPPQAAGRAALQQGVSRAQLRYWLALGVAVVAPIRPGYGPSPGGDLEQSGVRHDRTGRCISTPDYRRTADAATLTVFAALAWLRAQPWADARRVLLVGQSVGGLTTVAAGARRPPGVVGYINFAGGSGGDPRHSPGRSCDPGQIARLYGEYGRETTLPNLWMYALDDQYWGPDEPRTWHAAFARGGSPTTFVQAPPVPDGDGHGLSRHSPRLWRGPVDLFLARIGFPGRVAVR